ncbi:unnamed protein product [Adineta steineri]|uniref:3CxxC-type domain-containing protein n=1 Tax=Adineta steineri TaxID=433720 RepID=A0A813VXF9_9BILA|nr:unnamed protein product [Adineta steineri]CAF3644847.1 unnamed protein product [Adineta steineri]
MTGSIPAFTRQDSSTKTMTTTTTATTVTNMEKTQESKIHRPVYVDDSSLYKSKLDDHERKHEIPEYDSGTDDAEHQSEHKDVPESNVSDNQPTKQSHGQVVDEGFSECEAEEEFDVTKITADLDAAKLILDEVKKDFCHDTTVAFHGEFARLISCPLSLQHNVRYYLFSQEEIIVGDPRFDLNGTILRLDNAKAQFKCPHCQHAWTSMRARISFIISEPERGFIILKIFGQHCQRCTTYAEALWYIDEVCRVMKNLAKYIYETFSPDMLNYVDLTYQKPAENIKPIRSVRHDPHQRKGKSQAPHAKEFCEACRVGLCYA